MCRVCKISNIFFVLLFGGGTVSGTVRITVLLW